MQISFSSVTQARAVYDVVEHRVYLVSIDELLTSELELEEVMDLAAFLHRLRSLLNTKWEE